MKLYITGMQNKFLNHRGPRSQGLSVAAQRLFEEDTKGSLENYKPSQAYLHALDAYTLSLKDKQAWNPR